MVSLFEPMRYFVAGVVLKQHIIQLNCDAFNALVNIIHTILGTV